MVPLGIPLTFLLTDRLLVDPASMGIIEEYSPVRMTLVHFLRGSSADLNNLFENLQLSPIILVN